MSSRPLALAGARYHVALAAALWLLGQSAFSAAPAGERFAVLIGPTYSGAELQPLGKPRDDLLAMKSVLRRSGFAADHILLLANGTERRFVPDLVMLRQEIKRQLDNLEPADLVVIALAGHAVRFKQQKATYFCAQDTHLADRSTLLPFAELYQLLAQCRAGRKLVLADVCHRDPRSPAARGQAVELEAVPDPQAETVPPGVAVLFGCADGQISQLRKEDGSSLFFHSVVRGWDAGRADPAGLTVDRLFDYVHRETLAYSRTVLARQAPVRRGDTKLNFVLSDHEPGRQPNPIVQRPPPQHLERRYGLALKVRRAEEKTIREATGKVAVEVCREPVLGRLIYLSETGACSIAPGKVSSKRAAEGRVVYHHGMKLQARAAGEADFTDATRIWTIEVYRDEATGNLIYVTAKGSIAVTSGNQPGREGGTASALAVHRHGFELKVRKADEKRITAAPRGLGVEIWRDNSTDNLVFIADNGALAVVPAPAAPGDLELPEKPQRYVLGLRKAGKEDTVQWRQIAVEAYRESFSRQLLFLTQDGYLTVGGASRDDGRPPKHVGWWRGIDVKAGKSADPEAQPANHFGLELYRDPATGTVLCISQTGAISVGKTGTSRAKDE